MAGAWLHVIGIGAEGVEGLSVAARAVLASAAWVMGGARHVEMVHGVVTGEVEVWPRPFAEGVERVLARRGRPGVVLSSGDPFFYGVGGVLARSVPVGEMVCWPVPSSVSLACARLGWAREGVRVVSLCGRPLERLWVHLQPGARVLVLSADGGTPGLVAGFLRERGFGASRLWVLEDLGGADERVREFEGGEAQGLNVVGVEVVVDVGARVMPLVAGVPDEWFEHDGQITKREVRAVTLSALAPRQGEVLWDLGAGSGSVGVEWGLRHVDNRVVALERDAGRGARILRNAAGFGVAGVEVRVGEMDGGFEDFPDPDAIFVGGGVTVPGLAERVFGRLPVGGRLVANVVTLEGEAVLFDWQARFGGGLTRIGVDRLDMVGRMRVFRPAMVVTQYVYVRGVL